MIEQAIYTIMVATSSITDLVSTRIYWTTSDQNAGLPCIVIRKVSVTGRELSHSGPIAGAESRFQFDCLGSSALESKSVANAVRSLFHGYKGTSSGVQIFFAKAVNEVDFEELNLGHRVALDVVFTHSE